MSKPRQGSLLTFDQAASELPAAKARARAESTIYAEAYEQCTVQLKLLHGIMACERARSKSAMLRRGRARGC